MSVILAVCGGAFCAMVSDGRMVEEPDQLETMAHPKVVTEELPKVRKLNKNVCVGFAGDTLAAVQIINAVDEYQPQYLTMEKILKILQQKARTVACKPVGVRLLVGGRNRKGEFQLVSMGSAQNYEWQVQPARPDAYLIEGACSHTPIEPMLEQYVKPQAAAWRSLDDVAATLDDCIRAIAEHDETVNTQLYRQLIL